MQLIHALYHRRHNLGEVPELLISTLLKTLALALFGIFVPIYLYQLGFGLPLIALTYALSCLGRATGALVAAPLVSRLGPKHVMLGATGILLANLLVLIILPQHHGLVWVPQLLYGIYMGSYMLALHDDFSSSIRAGRSSREISWYYGLVRVVGAVGPVAGGALATLGGLPLSLSLAVALLVASVAVLMLTPEQPTARSLFEWRDLAAAWRTRDIAANAGNVLDTMSSTVTWPLLSLMVTLPGGAYLGLGAITTAGSIVSIMLGPLLTRFIDRGEARAIYDGSTWSSAAIHAGRTLATIPAVALGLGVAKDPSEMGMNITFLKGFYDQADRMGWRRLPYLALVEAAPQVPCAAFWLVAAALFSALPALAALRCVLVLGAGATLLMLAQRFPALNGSLDRSANRRTSR